MMRSNPLVIAAALTLACCTPRDYPTAPEPDANDIRDATVADATDVAVVAPDVAPVVDAAPDAPPAPDPCDFHAAVPLRLRKTLREQRPTTLLPTGTALELLAVTSETRGPIERLGVYSRVRVRATGEEGFVYLDADEVRRCQDSRVTAPDVREWRAVVVDGVEEIWRVRFVTPSRAPEPIPEGEWTCPSGFDARFDQGNAVLERLRNGVVIDRFHNPCEVLAEDSGCSTALLIPWHVNPSTHDRPLPAATVERLPWITFLDLADYDHDGRATEMAIDVGHLVCGHANSVVVGITRDNARLHTLHWANGGPMALTSGHWSWDQVRARPRGEMVTWGCGDHGYDGEERLRWWPAGGKLDAESFDVPMDEECHPLPEGAREEPAFE